MFATSENGKDVLLGAKHRPERLLRGFLRKISGVLERRGVKTPSLRTDTVLRGAIAHRIAPCRLGSTASLSSTPRAVAAVPGGSSAVATPHASAQKKTLAFPRLCGG
jgi:hypothetical protein